MPIEKKYDLEAVLKQPRLYSSWLGATQIRDPATVPALQEAMRAESDAALRVAYVRALSALGERSVDALRDLLDSKDAGIRDAAVHALAGRSAFGAWPWPWPRPRPNP